MTTYTATYSPDDNKLRLYASSRLDAETYARVKAAGFSWAPKQELFVAPMWTPEREDLLLELADEIEDEGATPAERAATRAERFEEYSEKRAADSASASESVRRLADGIPLGQPILVGHHSEKRARKDAERIENGMRRAVQMWETSKYWTSRAAASLAHADRMERPDVRARRIKKLESEARKMAKRVKESEMWVKIWTDPVARLKPKADGTRATLAEAVAFFVKAGWETEIEADPETLRVKLLARREAYLITAQRWTAHYENRLAYERAMLAEAGGTVADQTKPEAGGAVQSLWAPHGGWAYIVKVNKVTVTLYHTWSDQRAHSVKVPFDKLAGVMTRTQVEEARTAGRLKDATCGDGTRLGFYLLQSREQFDASQTDAPAEDTVCPDGATCPDTDCQTERHKQGLPVVSVAEIEAMRDTLKAGVTVVSGIPDLFPTPASLAARMVEEAGLSEGDRVLEPSAGTGRIIDAIRQADKLGHIVAVEQNHKLADALAKRYPTTNAPPAVEVIPADFLSLNGSLGLFDRILMNPPFSRGADLQHIAHARTHLKPGGRIVALCANGPRQQAAFENDPNAVYEPLPAGSFKESGTDVNVALVIIEG